jgi:hypothetical protein
MDTSETSATPDSGSGTAGEPGVAYDTDRVGEPGDPGVPTGDQYPTNERDNISEGGYGSAGIDDVPGTRSPGESVSSEPEPTTADRDAGSLGDLTQGVSTSEAAAANRVADSSSAYMPDDPGRRRSEKH